jgi:glycerophosphoryl diester phosphodiesterase
MATRTAFQFGASDHFLAIVHRGDHRIEIENSVAAFEAARSLGYRYIETDVRATAQGEIVVVHDAKLDRVFGRSVKVSGLFANLEVERLVPRLADVLAAFPETCFNIDVKERRSAKRIVATVLASGAQDRVCVASFSPLRMRRVRQSAAGSGILTAATPLEVGMLLLLGAKRSFKMRAELLEVPMKIGPFRVVTPRLIRLAHQRGLRVCVWTLNSAEEIDGALQLGVDGIMTDEPVLLKHKLQSRGLWPESV